MHNFQRLHIHMYMSKIKIAMYIVINIATLKGHGQLSDRADLDTSFVSLKSIYLNLKSKVRVEYI